MPTPFGLPSITMAFPVGLILATHDPHCFAVNDRDKDLMDYLDFLRKAMTAKTKKTIKQTLAIDAAVPAIPPNPRTAAMRATMRKTTV